MSVTLLLIPAAIAIAGSMGAVGAAGVAAQNSHATKSAAPTGDVPATGHVGDAVQQQEPVQLQVNTRMKDARLLGQALHRMGAVRIEEGDTHMSANIDALLLDMTVGPDGIWVAHVSDITGEGQHPGSVTPESASELISELDRHYALLVQETVAERIRQRADGAGFSLLSETRNNDASLTLVLNVQEGI